MGVGRSSACGTYTRNVICPVNGQTISLNPRAAHMSQNSSNRLIIRSSTPAWPAGVSGRGSSSCVMYVSYVSWPGRWASHIGWKASHLGNTRRKEKPCALRTSRSLDISSGRQSCHILVEDLDAQ